MSDHSKNHEPGKCTCGSTPPQDSDVQERSHTEEKSKTIRSILGELLSSLLSPLIHGSPTPSVGADLAHPEPVPRGSVFKPDQASAPSGKAAEAEATQRQPSCPAAMDVGDCKREGPTRTTFPVPGDSAPRASATVFDKPATQLSILGCVLIGGAVITLFHIAYIRTWPGTYAGSRRSGSEIRELRPRHWNQDQWHLAQVYREAMNRAAGPCANFQKFVCGRSEVPTLQRLRHQIQRTMTDIFRHTTIPPSNETGLEKAAALYGLCADVLALKQNRLTEMREFMLRMNIRWPAEDSATPTTENLLDVLVDLSVNWQLHPFFRLAVEPEPNPNGRVALLLLISPDLHQWLSNRKELRSAGLYHDFVCRHVSAFLGSGRKDEVEYAVNAFQHADSVVSIALSPTREPVPSPARILDEEESPLPDMPYEAFSNALQRHFNTNFTVAAADGNVLFLEQLAFLLKRSTKVAQTYMTWYLLRRIGPAASHEILEASYVLESSGRITEAWDQFCYTEVLRLFPLAIAAAYSEETSMRDVGLLASEIVGNVRDSLVDLLMEEDQSGLALDLKMLHTVIGQPLSTSSPKTLYKEVPDINLRDSFLETWLRTLKATGARLRRLLGRRTNVEILQHFLEPLEVEPFYYSPYHALVIPMGALQSPLLRDTFPVAVNYGAFGRIVAMVLLRSVATRNLTASRACMLRAMGPTSFTHRKRDVEGVLRFAESELPLLRAIEDGVPDHTRLEERLIGFQDFTAVQTMYIAGCYATCGEPDSRCDLYLRHSVRFAKAFNCSHETPMNPEKKCLLW